MTDIKFDILQAPKATQSELDRIMQPYIDSGRYSKTELAEIRKREANKIKQTKISGPEEKKNKKVKLGEGETANKKLVNADAKIKGGEGLTSRQYDDSAVDHNKLYPNTNPLHNRFRHDT